MSGGRERLANFVIGGTEKAGTTSVFDWLSTHPEVGASSRKETDFFREAYTGNPALDARNYAGFFEHASERAVVRVEASPGYLGEAATVAPRMRALVPQVKVLFILRDPIDRLYSSYHFHRGKLNLPQELTFDDYVRRCLAYDRRARQAHELGLEEWFLKVLRFGCYSEFLEIFRANLKPQNIQVMFFEALREDERAFMEELSGFLGIDAGHWADFGFRKSNVTFSARNRGLHRLAMRTNAIAEPFMRRYPVVKQSLVRVYKALNQDREGYDPMPAATRELLTEYYAPSLRRLQPLVGGTLPCTWACAGQGRAAA